MIWYQNEKPNQAMDETCWVGMFKLSAGPLLLDWRLKIKEDMEDFNFSMERKNIINRESNCKGGWGILPSKNPAAGFPVLIFWLD